MENPGSENLIGENYEEENEEEIMVEVVGSVVVVDGVPDHEEGNSRSKKVGDFEGYLVKNREETNFPTNAAAGIQIDPYKYIPDPDCENPNNVQEIDVADANAICPIENKDERLKTEIEVDTEDKNPSTTTLSNEKIKKFLEADSNIHVDQMKQSEYISPPHNGAHFSVLDLVWGKVKSHPWWPGQIFDPADASEKAMKHYKKDSFLVAYFGDQTFAWNDASALKPFRENFSQIEKQSNSEVFQNAVNCALEEVSRRVELGLVCSCTLKDAHSKIENQVVENSGIREESHRRYGVDECSRAESFEPEKLFRYVRELASSASRGAGRLDLVMARSQLSAFYRFNGHDLPAGIFSDGELLQNDVDYEQLSVKKKITSRKRKQIPMDNFQPKKKERSMKEPTGDRAYSSDDENDPFVKDLREFVSSRKKQKKLDLLVGGSDKKVNMKPSFKIGECILRAASQLTGSTPIEKVPNENPGIDCTSHVSEHFERRSMVFSSESSLPNEMLLKLQLLANDPKKRRDSLSTLITFFSGFRSSIALNKQGRKKKDEKRNSGFGEEFEFDSHNWTDRVVHSSENGEKDHQLDSFDSEKIVKSGRKSHSRNRFSMENELDENVKRKRQESAPAELILNFSEKDSVPSEINLNKIFRRFGQLMESETEVDRDSGRAKVIFRRGCDAEVACNSAEKFNIFGPVLVNYQIGYSPLISVKISPHEIPELQEEATVMI